MMLSTNLPVVVYMVEYKCHNVDVIDFVVSQNKLTLMSGTLNEFAYIHTNRVLTRYSKGYVVHADIDL